MYGGDTLAIPIGPYLVRRLHRRACVACNRPIVVGQWAYFAGVGAVNGLDIRLHRTCYEHLARPEVLRELF